MSCPQGSGTGTPAATATAPIRGDAVITTDNDGPLVVLAVATRLDPDAATDLALRLIGAVHRAKGARS